jgi:SAM-dependent methyltransferase
VPSLIRPTTKTSLRQLAVQWDSVAEGRFAQLRDGVDVSYDFVLLPTITRLARGADWTATLDVGCGLGILTERLAARASLTVGVDISRASIQLARSSQTPTSKVEYVGTSIEHFARTYKGRRFTLAVGNMLLQGVPSLNRTLGAIAQLLAPGATVVLTITHPWFWPKYWGYEDATWFHYDREIAIEAPFRISQPTRPLGRTTHFHRPLSTYIDALHRTGLTTQKIVEPMPSKAVARRYRRPWDFPRFLAFRCLGP